MQHAHASYCLPYLCIKIAWELLECFLEESYWGMAFSLSLSLGVPMSFALLCLSIPCYPFAPFLFALLSFLSCFYGGFSLIILSRPFLYSLSLWLIHTFMFLWKYGSFWGGSLRYEALHISPSMYPSSSLHYLSLSLSMSLILYSPSFFSY